MQKNFWIEHSADLTVEAMMLDSKASDLDKEERPEVIIIALSLSLSLIICILDPTFWVGLYIFFWVDHFFFSFLFLSGSNLPRPYYPTGKL